MPTTDASPPPDLVVVTTRNALRAIIADAVEHAVRRAVADVLDNFGHDDDWITVKVATKVYGRSRSTLHRWAKAGLLPSRKIAGGSVYYSRGAVARLAGQVDA